MRPYQRERSWSFARKALRVGVSSPASSSVRFASANETLNGALCMARHHTAGLMRSSKERPTAPTGSTAQVYSPSDTPPFSLLAPSGTVFPNSRESSTVPSASTLLHPLPQRTTAGYPWILLRGFHSNYPASRRPASNQRPTNINRRFAEAASGCFNQRLHEKNRAVRYLDGPAASSNRRAPRRGGEA